jgi:hypothetical protein
MKGRALKPLLGGAVVIALVAPGVARAAWQQPVGGEAPINREATRDASEPSIEEFAGAPYIAWAETDGGGVGQIQAARLDATGTAWERPEDAASPINLSSSESAEDPALRRNDPGDNPCVAFDEASGAGTQIHMSCLTTATDWTTVGDSPDWNASAVASEPSLTLFGDETWVAWSEVDSHGVNQIHAAKLPAPGTTWQRVPDTESPINALGTDNAFGPSLVVVGTRLYVAWSEIASEGAGEVSRIHVARLNTAGDAWEQVGGALNENAAKNAFEPSMAEVGGVPYVAWSETDEFPSDQIRVARLGGYGWEIVAAGTRINQTFDENAEHPSIVAIGGVPYVAWSEPNASGGAGQVRVGRLSSTGTAWEQVVGGESPINDNPVLPPVLPAIEPGLTTIGGLPYVGWSERNESGVEQIRVTRLVPEFLASHADALASDGATLETELRTYGLPFPVGFEYGKTLGEHETTPVTAPTGQGEVVTVSQPAGGLSPTTSYQAQPFATTGVPLPRTPGATFAFDTTAVQHTLTVAKAGSGAGQVTSAPAGIACGSTCAHSFDDGTAVTLEAAAAADSTFSGWSGGGCSGIGSCVVTMNVDATVTATFTQDPSPPGSSGGGPTSPAPPSSEPPPQNRPSAKILKARIVHRKGRATFRFAAVGGTAEGFQCTLARRRSRPKFSRCRSPKTYRHLKPGKYFFEVRALGAAAPESSPAVRPFRLRP